MEHPNDLNQNLQRIVVNEEDVDEKEKIPFENDEKDKMEIEMVSNVFVIEDKSVHFFVRA